MGEAVSKIPAWPEPYLQPDKREGCSFYAAAYICRCFGYADTADQVLRWKEETRFVEEMYPEKVHGIERHGYWEHRHDEPGWDDYWMGPAKLPWLIREFNRWGLAMVMVHRVQTGLHAVVLLDIKPNAVRLMDPAYGMVTEPVDWLLGPGPGQGAHHVASFYRLNGGIA